MPSKHDLALLLKNIACDNCELSYRRLFHILFPSLKRFAFAIVKSSEQAEEIASDVLITLWRDRLKLNEIRNINVYSFVLAKNFSLNYLRKNFGYEVSLEEVDIKLIFDNSTPEQILITEELRQNLSSAVESLPPKCKMVFQLVKEEGLSYKEVSEVLNISVKTVDAHLVIALKKISESIRTEYNLVK